MRGRELIGLRKTHLWRRSVGALWAAEVVGGIATLGFVRGGELFFLDVDRGYLGVPMAGRSLAPN